MRIPCISLWHPWAHLMAINAKYIETRSWPITHRGPLAIHAAKKWQGWQQDLCFSPTFLRAMRENESDAGERLMERIRATLGCIVCVVNVDDCKLVEEITGLSVREMTFGDYSPGRYGWITSIVRRFKKPIPCVGRQALFEVEILE